MMWRKYPKGVYIQATAGKLLVQPMAGTSQTPSGLIVMLKKEYPMRGRVISVGDDFTERSGKVIKAPAKEGDIVQFKRHHNVRITNRFDEKVILAISFIDVVAVEPREEAHEKEIR